MIRSNYLPTKAEMLQVWKSLAVRQRALAAQYTLQATQSEAKAAALRLEIEQQTRRRKVRSITAVIATLLAGSHMARAVIWDDWQPRPVVPYSRSIHCPRVVRGNDDKTYYCSYFRHGT